MLKKKFLISIAIIMLVILSACSSLSALTTSTTSATPIGKISTASATQTQVKSKLGMGILKLEGTGQAVTTEQATNLLFLWKGVKTLTSTQNSSSIELAALYTQIEQSLTAEQVQTIQQLNLTQSDIAALRSQYSSQLAQGGPSTGTTANTGSSTSSKSSSQSNSSNFQGGGPGGFGGGPGGGSDIQAVLNGNTAGVVSQTSSTTTSSTTAQKSGTASTAKISIDYNAMFADSVIALLQQRVGL